MDATHEKTIGQWLEAAIDGSLHLGSSACDLQEEIANNIWRLHGSPEEIAGFDADKLKRWLDTVIANREQQLLAVDPIRRAIFYVWLDTQVVQLRFNVISNAHERLPFRRRYNLLLTPDPILHDFLARSNRDEGWLDEDPDDWEEYLERHGFDVYAIALPRGIWNVSDWAGQNG
jgi:hypothetical protein